MHITISNPEDHAFLIEDIKELGKRYDLHPKGDLKPVFKGTKVVSIDVLKDLDIWDVLTFIGFQKTRELYADFPENIKAEYQERYGWFLNANKD